MQTNVELFSVKDSVTGNLIQGSAQSVDAVHQVSFMQLDINKHPRCFNDKNDEASMESIIRFY